MTQSMRHGPSFDRNGKHTYSLDNKRRYPNDQLTVPAPLPFEYPRSRPMRWQIHCRNRHGSNRRGKKVTGLAFVETSQLRRGGRQPCGSPTGCAAASAACAAGCYEGDAALEAMAASRAGHGDVKDERLGVGKADSMSAQYSLLSTTNDSRLRIHDLDNFAMVRA